MNTTQDERQWYVQKGSRVQGPFGTNEVGRFLLLGRVRNTDRVSRDGELWEPVTQIPELIPEELLNLQNDEGWNAFLRPKKKASDEDSCSDEDTEAPVVCSCSDENCMGEVCMSFSVLAICYLSGICTACFVYIVLL